MAQIKDILCTELSTIELKPGMIVQVQKEEDCSIHNMLIAEMGGRKIAVEIFSLGDKLNNFSYDYVATFCFLDQSFVPTISFGIEKCFGDYVVAIYPQFSPNEDEIVYRVIDENHCIMLKHKSN